MVRTVTSQQEGPEVDSKVRACLCGVSMSSLCLRGFAPGTLPSSDSPTAVNVSVDGCLVPTCQPCDEPVTCPGCTLPSPQDAEIGSSSRIQRRILVLFKTGALWMLKCCLRVCQKITFNLIRSEVNIISDVETLNRLVFV